MKKTIETYVAPMAEVIELQSVGVLMASAGDGGGGSSSPLPSGPGWHGKSVGYESVDLP